MKKSLQDRLNASLDKALDPPRKRPKQELDALLDEYDDGQTLSAQKGFAPEISKGIPEGIPTPTLEEQPQDSISASKKARRPIPRKTPEEAEEPSSEIFVSVDATHTASEKIIYSHMYRETVSKERSEGHFGPALLMKLSGIRSRNTVHKALYGLVEKLSVEKVAESTGNPFGPRYRVHGPQEILRRRKAAGMVIDPQTKKIMERGSIPVGVPTGIPGGIPEYPSGYPKFWDTPIPNFGIVGIPKFGILLNRINNTDVESSAGGSSSNELEKKIDDEAFAGFVGLMRRAAEEVTGHAPTRAERERWLELAEVLSAELRIAAGRTTVSSAPAFLAEHLRRRLWKKDKRQMETEAAQQKPSDSPKLDASQCQDCFGTGMWYPEGFEKGVARCEHKALGKQDDESR